MLNVTKFINKSMDIFNFKYTFKSISHDKYNIINISFLYKFSKI
jgi:hypothetical protein